jgi:hypothetical protein
MSMVYGRNLCLWAFALLLASFGGMSTAAFAQLGVHVNIDAIGGTPQTISVGQQFPQAFVARVTYDDGTPVVGTTIDFEVNGCFVFSGDGNTCPPISLYGRFPNATTDGLAVTDANGIVTSPLFTAGSTPGQYQIFATVVLGEVVNGQKITDFPPTNNEFFSLTQINYSLLPIPTLSRASLIVLLLTILAAGFLVKQMPRDRDVSLR